MWRGCLLVALAACFGACSSGAKTPADADSGAGGDSGDGDVAACYPLFHACTTNDDCCAPNRCLNITGSLACQQEGPAQDAADSDAVQSQPDAAQSEDTGGQDAPACYPLFASCTATEQCCAPNRCINITGTPACQQEGPRVDGGS